MQPVPTEVIRSPVFVAGSTPEPRLELRDAVNPMKESFRVHVHLWVPENI